LELRGGGDPLGLKQSGFPAYRFADPAAHRHLIAAAADDARLILARDPQLTSERGQAVRILQELFDWRVGGTLSAAGSRPPPPRLGAKTRGPREPPRSSGRRCACPWMAELSVPSLAAAFANLPGRQAGEGVGLQVGVEQVVAGGLVAGGPVA